MNYDFIAIPDQDVPQAAAPLFQHLVVTYASETNKTASMCRAIPDDLLNFKPHEKFDSSHPGPPDSLGATVLRSVRRHSGTTGRGATASWRSAPRASLPGQVRRASETKVTAACRSKHRLVADQDALLRRAATATDLDILAAGLAHLPPSDTDPDLAAAGGSARPCDLRTIG